MSRQDLKESFQGALILIIIAGILLIVSGIISVIILTWLNPSSTLQDVILLLPLFIVGFVIIGVSVKVLEILE